VELDVECYQAASLLVLGTVERVVSEKCFWTLRYVVFSSCWLISL